MEAASLRAVDESHNIHLQAWLIQSAQAQKKVGKRKTRPLYQRFTDFFDYDKAVRTVTEKDAGKQGKKSITERMMEYMKGRK